MAVYYLNVFRDQGHGVHLETFEFVQEDGHFTAWADKNDQGEPLNDQVSAIEYRLPRNWGVLLMVDRDPNCTENERHIGDGSLIRVDEDGLQHRDCLSAHKWIWRHGPCGWP